MPARAPVHSVNERQGLVIERHQRLALLARVGPSFCTSPGAAIERRREMKEIEARRVREEVRVGQNGAQRDSELGAGGEVRAVIEGDTVRRGDLSE